MPRRPPDILRKSHAHSEGDTRARGKRELSRQLADDDGTTAAALLIDLDGVLYDGRGVIEGAVDAVERLRAEAVAHLFVTNTTSRPRSAIVERLAGMGIAVDADTILTPPVAAAAWLRERGATSLALFVPEATREEFAGFDLEPAGSGVRPAAGGSRPSPVDAVVIGDYGERWSFAELNRAFRLLMVEPRPLLIALGMTRYWQAPDGLRLDTAPFVTALAHATGAEPVVLGKPAAAFFEMALSRLGVAPGEAWMLGDDVLADVKGAQDAGLRTILVKTGKFRPGDLERDISPDLVLDSIADLADRWPPTALHRQRDSR